MYLDHRLLVRISGVLSRLSMNIMLMDSTGHVIYPEDNGRELTLPEALRAAPMKPLVYGGFTLIGTDENQPMFLCLPGDSPDVCSCAILASELIGSMTRVELPAADKNQTYCSVLREDVDGVELESMAKENGIPNEALRCAMLLYLQGVETDAALEILNNVILPDSQDAVVEMDRHTIAIVKTITEDDDFEEVEQLADAIENTFAGETSHSLYIGIGEPKQTLTQLSASLKEARRAIDVGKNYHSEAHVFVYRKLILERLLADIPKDVSNRYYSVLFNRKTARLFNDEMMHTIETLFENSLNISETARQLYIHRNTLVYRLDKVQRIVGLDLRAFDDAVTFKMLMLLGKNAVDKRRN